MNDQNNQNNQKQAKRENGTYKVSEQTGKVINAIVMVEKAWSEICSTVGDIYEDADISDKTIEGFTSPFSEIERQLGQILIDSVTDALCQTKNEYQVI